MLSAPIEPDSHPAALTIRDLTDPASGFHAMQLLVEDAEIALRNTSRCRACVHRAPQIVSVADHFDHLAYPSAHPERGPTHACYLDACSLFRRHTTAAVPALLRSVSAVSPADLLMLLPGIVCHPDCSDPALLAERHELDIWRVRNDRPFSAENSETMIASVVGALLPDHRYRLAGGEQPYLSTAMSIQVFDGNRWIQVGDGGLVDPRILEMNGLAPNRFAAWAMRLSLEHVLMLRKRVRDARLFRSSDPAVMSQMRDLAAYHSAVDKLSTTAGSSPVPFPGPLDVPARTFVEQ